MDQQHFIYLPFILLFLPLIAAAEITFFSVKSRQVAAFISISACAVSFLAAVVLLGLPGEWTFPSISWLEFKGVNLSGHSIDILNIQIGVMTDHLARLMLVVVTGVGLLIHIFSYGYMEDDPGICRFFAKLSLFMFSMLGIVLANNLVMMFIFWELVGLSSYLLIGFWFGKASAADAAKKAFIVNRIGDFGFLLGILLTWQLWHSVGFAALAHNISIHPLIHVNPHLDYLVFLAGFGLFCGCIGKSAQFPLHVWLPDAMEGPTPVSALIHAATMVAAGVYMLCRVFFILRLSSEVLFLITAIGTLTAFFAALTAIQQNDIKRILAYSTLSQLGYMVAVVGLGTPDNNTSNIAMFHLTTHACFKALLFLGAGAVIHSLHHEQDIWKMGGLMGRMKVTSIAFLAGTAALIGVPFFAGFFSKEAILTAAFNKNYVVFVVLLMTAFVTAFYMTRLVVVAFFGKARSETAEHVHEAPFVMLMPLLILAILAFAAGYLPVEKYLSSPHDIRLLFTPDSAVTASEGNEGLLVKILAGMALILGVWLAWDLYHDAETDPVRIRVFEKKFYTDEIYGATIIPLQAVFAAIASWLDRWVVEMLLVKIPALLGVFAGELLRVFQGGSVSYYIALFIAGVLFILSKVLLS